MDPLASILMALRLRAAGVKLITGTGAWGARYAAVNNAGFGLVLTGTCWLRIGAGEPLRFAEGDFVLMPPNPGFAIYTDTRALSANSTPVRRPASPSYAMAIRKALLHSG